MKISQAYIRKSKITFLKTWQCFESQNVAMKLICSSISSRLYYFIFREMLLDGPTLNQALFSQYQCLH